MRIIITGGAGFIGTNLCILLKKKYPHYSIIAFDNLKRRGSEFNLKELLEQDIEFIHGDIRNKEDLKTLNNFDLLIDASAESSVLSGYNSDHNYIINNNLIGSLNCFDLCINNKSKLIFLSTSRVYPIDRIEKLNYIESKTRFLLSELQYENGVSRLGISENFNLNGHRSLYGTTKLTAELFIEEYAAFNGLQATITRFGVIAGPRQMAKADQGIATLWMAKHFWKQPLKYIGYGGEGKQVRDILHVNDLVNLIDYQIHNFEKFVGKTFNAGGGVNNSISLQEMTNICEQITGNKLDISKENKIRIADLRIFITDNTKIINETGWEPKLSLINIFEDTFNWIYKNEKELKIYLN